MARSEHRVPGSRVLAACVPERLSPSASGSWDSAPIGLRESRLGNTQPKTALPRLPQRKARSRLPLPPAKGGHPGHCGRVPSRAYPPAWFFGFSGGGWAGRRSHLFGSPRPRCALPAQGPLGAGPPPIVIPRQAQTQARALGPRPVLVALPRARASARQGLVLHFSTNSQSHTRHWCTRARAHT